MHLIMLLFFMFFFENSAVGGRIHPLWGISVIKMLHCFILSFRRSWVETKHASLIFD